MAALVQTFQDDTRITAILLSGPSSTGLCKIDYNGKTMVRHVDRLEAINEEAAQLLKKA